LALVLLLLLLELLLWLELLLLLLRYELLLRLLLELLLLLLKLLRLRKLLERLLKRLLERLLLEGLGLEALSWIAALFWRSLVLLPLRLRLVLRLGISWRVRGLLSVVRVAILQRLLGQSRLRRSRD